MNGTKILILGNHDRGPTAMYALGFDVVMYNATLYIAQETVTMSHCPLRGVKREDVTNYAKHDPREMFHGELRPKYQKFMVKDYGQFHLHGHIHSRPDKKGTSKILGRQYDVGVTANQYRPVSISQIESFIVKTKQAEEGISKATENIIKAQQDMDPDALRILHENKFNLYLE